VNLWTWGDDHFFMSDTRHLMSGLHAHGAMQPTLKPQNKYRFQIAEEDRLLMDIVREYVKRIV
jgi:hypothetical protein